MIQERSVGVVEARIGLSLLTCLLVALGYAVLQRIGDEEPSASIQPHSRQVLSPTAAAPTIGPSDLDQPQILTAQGGEWTSPGVEIAAPPFADEPPFSDELEQAGDTDDLRRASYPFKVGTTR